MIVIEGRAGKSKVLESIIATLNDFDRMVIADTVGVKGLVVPKGAIHYIIDQNMLGSGSFETATLNLVEELAKEEPKLSWIVLEVNTHPSNITLFKDAEIKHEIKLVLTVQNDTMSEVSVYNI